MKVLVVVEDDPDMRFLVQLRFATDPRFEIAGNADTAEEAIELARGSEPGLIVLDHALNGVMTGLEAAPLLKEAAPNAKIILFTAHSELRDQAIASQAVDAFLLKTDIEGLLPLAQRLVGFDPTTP